MNLLQKKRDKDNKDGICNNMWREVEEWKGNNIKNIFCGSFFKLERISQGYFIPGIYSLRLTEREIPVCLDFFGKKGKALILIVLMCLVCWLVMTGIWDNNSHFFPSDLTAFPCQSLNTYNSAAWTWMNLASSSDFSSIKTVTVTDGKTYWYMVHVELGNPES